jgi:putative SOS response-associated peptidase YedK
MAGRWPFLKSEARRIRAFPPRNYRCLVPATSLSEYAPEPNPATGKKDIVWFALLPESPMFCFAGLWTE